MTAALSQPSTGISPLDSNKVLGVKKGAILTVLTRAYEADIYQQQNKILLRQVDTLQARITIKENIISTMKGQIDDYKSIVSSKDAIISNEEDQKRILQNSSNALARQLKRQKNKTKWTALLGIVTTTLALSLFITK